MSNRTFLRAKHDAINGINNNTYCGTSTFEQNKYILEHINILKVVYSVPLNIKSPRIIYVQIETNIATTDTLVVINLFRIVIISGSKYESNDAVKCFGYFQMF